MRLLLVALVEQHERSPGRACTIAALLAAGWPGERVLPAAGKRRVYVAIATLRELGLAPVIVTAPDGYALRADVAVRRADGAPASHRPPPASDL